MKAGQGIFSLVLGVRSGCAHGFIFIIFKDDDEKAHESGCNGGVCPKVTHRNACRKPRAVCLAV